MNKQEIKLPDYNHSILNLINTILKYYDVDIKYNTIRKLENRLLKKKYKNIVLIILDGMGEKVLKDNSPNGFFVKNQKDTITSVWPSTTTAAMTTYYSGKPPIETGWIAMSQYFKEYGRAIEMFKKVDSYTGEKINFTRHDVFNTINYKTIYKQIEEASPEVNAYEINPEYCEGRSEKNRKANTIEDMCEEIEKLCTKEEKKFILVYHDNPDVILHRYGCHAKETEAFIKNAEKTIEKMCNNINKEDSLIIIAADHGHKDIEQTYNIWEWKEIQECLIMPPYLESRAVSFWVKEDKKQEFEQIFKEKLKQEFLLYTKEELLQKNLMGFGIKHSKIDDFIGNYVAISIGNSILKLGTYLSQEKTNKKSTHCGLTPDEMLIPLIMI